MHVCAMACLWRSEDKFGELGLSFYYVDSKDRTLWAWQQAPLLAQPSHGPSLTFIWFDNKRPFLQVSLRAEGFIAQHVGCFMSINYSLGTNLVLLLTVPTVHA